MTEKITVEFDVEDNGSPKIAKVNAELNDTKQAAENASSGTEKASLSLTDLYSAGRIAEQVFSTLKDVYVATAGETLNYAEQVRQLSSISGESTENTSRFIQVLDDYKLSADDALAATRTLTKNGYAPNIDTLAQLSDQYLSLTSAQEKNDFILKNLGRSGLGWVQVLEKGSKAIKEQGAAVSESLVLTQKMVDAARANEIAVDNWNDAVQGLKISIGNQLLPVMTSFVNEMNAGQRAAEILAEQHKPLVMGSEDYRNALLQAEQEIEATNQAMLEQANAADEAAQSSADYQKQLEDISKANKEYLSTIGDVSKEIDSYKEKESDLQAQHADLLDEKQKLLDQGWWVESDAVQAVNDKLKDNEEAQAQNAEAFDKATKSRMLSMLEEQLAVDGLDQKESEFLLQQGLKWGIYSQEAIDAMAAIQRQVDAMERNIDININVHTNYSEAGQAALTTQLAGEKGYVPKQHSTGGTFMIPMQYGNEGFRMGNGDTASGGEVVTITPKGQNPNADLIAAIYATRIDYAELARTLSAVNQQGAK